MATTPANIKAASKLPSIMFWVYFAGSDKTEEMDQNGLGKISEPDFHICNTEAEAKVKREEIVRARVMADARKLRAKAKVERDRMEFERLNPGLARKNRARTEEALEDAEKSVAAAKAVKADQDKKRGESTT